jgi:hypothetical protein
VVVVEEAGTTARGGLWRSEVGEVEEIMDELVMAFGGRFESETIGAVAENGEPRFVEELFSRTEPRPFSLAQ